MIKFTMFSALSSAYLSTLFVGFTGITVSTWTTYLTKVMGQIMKTKYLKVAKKYLVEGCPNFSATGSIKGMRDKYYGKNALLVKCGSYIYNVTPDIYEMI